MNVGSGFSDAAREVDLTVANTGGLAARGVSTAGVSTDLAVAVAADLADVEDLADRAAKVLSAALVAGASGCSRPAISSW
jgi:hypothetical protein